MTLTRTLTRLIDLLYVKPLRRIVPPQTFRYAACGGLNMALDLSLYFLLYNFVLDKRVVMSTVSWRFRPILRLS